MDLLKFKEIYPNEESCKHKFREIRDKQEVVCSHCGCKKHYWKGVKWQYECKISTSIALWKIPKAVGAN